MQKLTTTGASTWIKRLAKTGLIAKGIVYILTGILTALAAMHNSRQDSQDADKGGIFKFIYDQPLGKVALLIIAAGLLCYASWRFVLCFKDTEHKGNHLKGLLQRAVYFFSGLVYLSISFLAVKIALFHQTVSGNSRQKLAGELLQKPLGKWLAAIVAIGMMVVGIGQLYRALSGKYKKYVQSGAHIHQAGMSLLVKSGKAGYISRGIVWMIIGWLFLKASLHSNAKEAGDTGNAFQWIQENSYGNLLLGAIALGLVCYGIFMFVRARYQPIHYR